MRGDSLWYLLLEQGVSFSESDKWPIVEVRTKVSSSEFVRWKMQLFYNQELSSVAG